MRPAPDVFALDVRDVMTPEVIQVSSDATLADAVEVMGDRRVHAVLVVGSQSGTPLGWVTVGGLVGLVGADPGMPATDAVTEEPRAIEPSAGLRAAVYALALPGVARLLVRKRGETSPTGVVSEYDVTVKATRLLRSTTDRDTGAARM